MSKINVDLRRLAGEERTHRLKQAIDHAGSVDTLNIAIDPVDDRENIDLFEVLSANGYAVQTQSDQEQAYNISAHRFH